MSSRERILGRVRRALADVREEDAPIERAYLREHGERSVEQTVDLLAENLADYRAVVHRTDFEELPYLIMRLLAARGPQYVLVPPGLPPEWMSAADPTRVHDRAVSTPQELDRVESVVTGCALAIAETGTIVLASGRYEGRRALTLVPDLHICVVFADAVVGTVPEAVARIPVDRPVTFVSGPSATSDIELTRVRGVHGPRRLDVVVVQR